MTDPGDVRLRFTLVIEYDAKPDHYEGADGDPAAMAAMDLESVKAGHLSPYDLGEATQETVEVVAGEADDE